MRPQPASNSSARTRSFRAALAQGAAGEELPKRATQLQHEEDEEEEEETQLLLTTGDASMASSTAAQSSPGSCTSSRVQLSTEYDFPSHSPWATL